MWSILSTNPLLFELCPKVPTENPFKAANLADDIAAEHSTAMSIGDRLSDVSSAAVRVVLSGRVMQSRASRCIRTIGFLYGILLTAVLHTKARLSKSTKA